MDNSQLTLKRSSIMPIRALVIGIGAIVVVIALVADWIGLSAPGSFSTGQILLLSAGLLILLIGLLGQRIATLYRDVAVLGLNTLILLACIELTATIALKLESWPSDSSAQLPDSRAALPYYRSQDWGLEYWREFELNETREGAFRYHPYLVWKSAPFESVNININQDGIRWTPNANCSAASYKVFAFGGSTMWGDGAPDWGTIPAYLQAGLQANSDKPICVVNFGERGFVSTQNLIELLLQLQVGNVPDLVIFYDGINDVSVPYRYGQPGAHYSLDDITNKFEKSNDDHQFKEWLKRSSSFSLFQNLVAKSNGNASGTTQIPTINYQTMGLDTENLATATVQIYLTNYRIVGLLAQEYGFNYFFFWQPALSIGEKPLTKDEQIIKDALDPALIKLYDVVYQDIEAASSENENLYYIVNVLDEADAQIWIDWQHITPPGNQLIAQAMLDIIASEIVGE